MVQAVGTFYGACVDETARETAGTTGIDPLLKTVRSVRDLPSLVAAVAELHGKLTLGENIADIGVLKLAFRAYRALRNGAGPRVVADGFNDDQQFFLSYGQSQCTKWREERMRTLLQTDTHSPHKFQVNGSVSNTPEFASAFSCPVGKTLNPETRCDVW